jgi:hypothetical protein
LLSILHSQISFQEKKDSTYNHAPKLRIRGSFKDVSASDLKLSFLPAIPEESYSLSTDSSGNSLVLRLEEGRQWVTIDPADGFVKLYLQSALLDGTEKLDAAIQVARVIPTPTVKAAPENFLHLTDSPVLKINGTDFNPKATSIFFDPPLKEGVDFQKKVTPTQIVIRKMSGDHAWRPDGPGPLMVTGIDTGAGIMALSGPTGTRGIIIAEVQVEGDAGSAGTVTIMDRENVVKVYQSTKSFDVVGTGFTPDMRLAFDNGLRGKGTNYTANYVDDSTLSLSLSKGSAWSKQTKALPAPLTILSATSGSRWVPLGKLKRGRRVATIYPDPSVLASADTLLHRSHSHNLFIKGGGFLSVPAPVFDFDPPLTKNSDYTVNVLGLDTCEIILRTSWMPEGSTGELKVKGMDGGAGKLTFPSPVVVATVIEDEGSHESGLTLTPGHVVAIYQSLGSAPLVITGTGFSNEPKIEFDEPLKLGKDYKFVKVSSTSMTLELLQGKKWRQMAGPLVIMSIDNGEGSGPVTFAKGNGIKVASVLEDPVVTEEENHIYASRSKKFTIHGSGFVSMLNSELAPKLEIARLPSMAYEITSWLSTSITLQLKEGEKWGTVDEGEQLFLKVSSIDTGAGIVELGSGGVTVATIFPDRADDLCDDSCYFANDGNCDEPSSSGGGGGWSSTSPWYSDDDSNYYSDYPSFMNYYMGSDDLIPAWLCDPGTDCTDCSSKPVIDGTCENTCVHARDGNCDDPRVEFGGWCPLGTDCQDCGPVNASNYTENEDFYSPAYYMSDSYWYNDDDGSFFLDSSAILGQEGNAKAPYARTFEDHISYHHDQEGAGSIFMDVLWAVVLLVGGTVSLGFCMIVYRHVKSGGREASSYLPVEQEAEQELTSLNRNVGVTPEVVHTDA